MSSPTTRRDVIKTIVLGSAWMATPSAAHIFLPESDQMENSRWNGRIHHSACYWCYQSIPLDDFCAALRQMGLSAIDLLQPNQFEIAKNHGLQVSMCYGGDLGIPHGWNNPDLHDQLVKNYSENIPVIAKCGFKNVICFSGNRNGMDDETGLQNCVKGLKRILPIAEKYKVTMVMELLNSKVDHHDYMCDHTAWGVELCKRLDSEYFKLLFDIYHMQIMEGDIIRTIRDNHTYIAHYHTGGVPGRHEIDDTQELYYPAIMRAIAEAGFQGHVAQEFVPTARDAAGKLAALQKCIRICDV
ncbi:hydroxypyruvate isomerase [Thermoflavifilum aggregans]|uniref:Hydroxypyruvate isomerase n=1 Tax=Thermoflavifilum aggregans TaxID=454188 RepID=A0A2M9CRS0_9BACT|nr:TIM barrel protein [Thermoflavifilum aggregans]PJJ74603.1 hydroxypyruvate isomerase [Thermoflavifilum aggregans]